MAKTYVALDPPRVVTGSLRIDHGPLPADRVYCFYDLDGNPVLDVGFMAYPDHVVVFPGVVLGGPALVPLIAKMVVTS